MQLINLDKVAKSFNDKPILREINFQVEEGSFVSIFGPNAAGKTTLLNIISGIIVPDSGKVNWMKRYSKDKVSYVFQNYRETLFPWKNVWENISLPLKLRGENKSKCKSKVIELAKKFSIAIDLEKYPYELSGGQQQLIAILRAVITDPVLLLLDEPFSALDFARRLELQQKILEIWHEIKTTIIFVSHDLDEAIYLADEVILLGDKPTTIIKHQKIEMERPRDSKDLISQEFVDYKKQLLSEFLSENAF